MTKHKSRRAELAATLSAAQDAYDALKAQPGADITALTTALQKAARALDCYDEPVPVGCTRLIVEERTDSPRDSLYSVHLQLETEAFVTFDCHTREAAERLQAAIDVCRHVSFN